MTFDFIHDKKFKEILERDYNELTACFTTKSSKSILLLSGSIVESVLTDFFIENLPTGKSKNDILKSNLVTLLDFAETAKLITSKEKQLAVIIKDYRNLIHPGKEVRTKEEFDFETAKLAKILLDIILKKLRTNHFDKYGYSADETLEKLKNDWEFQSVYGMVITKLHKNEREKLLTELIKIEQIIKSNFEHYKLMSDYDPKSEIRDLGNLEEVKPRIQELKPLLSNDIITEQLTELKDAVIRGESIKVLSLYNLFHEEIHQLDKDDQELIAVYMLSLYESIFEDSRDLANDKTYSTIGKYIHTQKGKEKIQTLAEFCVVHFGGDEWHVGHQMDVFQQIFNSVNTDTQDDLKKGITDFMPKERDKVSKYGLWPFYDEAVKRNIIDEKYSS